MESNIQKYTQKLKNYYNEEGLLVQYPTKRPLRVLALMKIANTFQADLFYTEKEINEIIKNHIVFTDVELVRRELYQYRILGREKDGSKYWLIEDWKRVEELI